VCVEVLPPLARPMVSLPPPRSKLSQRSPTASDARSPRRYARRSSNRSRSVYGVAFSADINKEQAMDEVRKVQDIKGIITAPIWLLQRQEM
jgi:hypothetical protein